jgi:LuxR family transcriptional regulator, maltose regulon positive regulatory protein
MTRPSFEIDRDRLWKALCGAGAPNATLISAGIGFGKSVLISQLASWLDNVGHPNSVVRFDDVAQGESGPHAAIEQSLVNFLDDSSDSKSITGILSDPSKASACQFRENCHLLLDDYHRVRTPVSDALLAQVLEMLPQGSRIIAAGRFVSSQSWSADTNLPFGNFIFEEMLRFDEEELSRLARQIPNFDGQRALFERMHGWAAGCAMICACVSATPNLSAAVFGHQISIAIEDYLGEMLDGLFESEEWTFAELLSVCPNFDVDDPTPDEVGRLARFYELGLLESAGKSGAQVRLQQPFRDIIHDRFYRRDSAGYEVAVREAAAWLVEADRWDELRELLVRMPREVRKLALEDAGGWMLDVRFGPHLFTELGLSADENFSDFPRLQLAKAVHLAKGNRAHEAQWLLTELGRHLSPDDDHLWRAELCINRVRISMFADQIIDEEELEELTQIQYQDLSVYPTLYALTAGVLCDALYRLGHYQKSRDIGLRGLVLCDHYNAPYTKAYIFALVAFAEYRIGDLAHAGKLAQQMSEHLLNRFPASSSLHDVAAIIAAVVRYEEGDLDATDALLARPLENVLAREGWLEVAIAGYFTAANSAIQRRDYDKALKIMLNAEEVGARFGFERMPQLAQCHALFLLSCADRIAEAAVVNSKDAFPKDSLKLTHWRWRDHVSVSHVRAMSAFLIAQGDLEEALAKIDDYLLALGGTDNVPSYVRLMCLRLVALAKLHSDVEEIAAAIRTIYRYSEKRGYVGGLLEFPALKDALKTCLTRPNLPFDAQRLASTLFERITHAEPNNSDTKKSLSPRQTQILTLLSDGLSNKEIANRLALAEGTVKSYRKALYQKLDVSRRSQAIARARVGTDIATPPNTKNS